GLRTTLLIAAAPPVLQVINSTPSAPNKLVPMMMLMAVVLCLFIIFSLWKTFRSIFTPPVSKPLRLAEEPEPDLSELEADELSEQFTSPDDISNEDNQSL
ncbi:MAG: hypothetical protein KDA65_11060, partial [Planctomycetaceae bacterium]|nr:hypothetical protein [Planctomycetaceae bacterium]